MDLKQSYFIVTLCLISKLLNIYQGEPVAAFQNKMKSSYYILTNKKIFQIIVFCLHIFLSLGLFPNQKQWSR